MFSSWSAKFKAVLEYLDQPAIYQDSILFLLTVLSDSTLTQSSVLYFFSMEYWQHPLIQEFPLTQVGRGLLKYIWFIFSE